MTRKEFWQKKVSSQIYMLGINFAREYYNYKVLPKLTIKRLKQFYFDYHEMVLEQKYQLEEAKFKNEFCDWSKVKEINGKFQKKKVKLMKELEK